MGAEDSVPKQIAGVIPHFWFDVLGRIVPGAFLLVGLFSEDWQQSLTSFVHTFAKDFPLTSHSVGFFLLFSAASFFVGHFLGVLSHYFIAWPVAFLWPIKKGSVQSPNDLPIPQMLKNCMESFMCDTKDTSGKHAGVRTHKIIARQSEALAHWLWIRGPELAILVSRWAADSLAGRSVALASVILLASKWHGTNWQIKVFLVILFFCGVMTHYHYRNKNITNAFYFSAMFDPSPGGEPAKKK